MILILVMVNTTERINASAEIECWLPTWGYHVSVAQVLGYCLTWTPVITILVNVIALVYILKVPKLKTNTRTFLFSLTICDIFIGLVIMPFRIFGLINSGLDSKVVLDTIYCDIGNAIDVSFSIVTAMHLVILSFDRYLASCRPFQLRHWLNRKTCLIFFVLSWVIPLGVTLGLFPAKVHLTGVDNPYHCRSQNVRYCHLMLSVSFAMVFTAISYVLPAVCIILCNHCTKKAIEKRMKVFTRLLQINTTRGSYHRRHFGTKLARTIILLTWCSLGSWLPYFVINTVDPLTGYRVPPYVWLLVTWIKYSKSFISPVLYLKAAGFFNPRFS